MLARRLLASVALLSLALSAAACSRPGGRADGADRAGREASGQGPSDPGAPGGRAPGGEPDRSGEPALPGGLLVIVENHPDARPQSGLDRADLVYEADIVAGITRFLALYYRQEAPEIGPVRSARWAFYHLALGHGLPLAHAGADADVLAEIGRARRRGFPDLDEIYGAGEAFWRSRERRMPHNLYTSTGRLLAGARSRGYRLAPPEGFPPLAPGEEPPAGGERAAFLRVPFAECGKNPDPNVVTWEYRDGRYNRAVNGRPHVMRDGAAIRADNVVVLVTDTETTVRFGEPVKDNRVTGDGEALFFTRGRVYRGRWSKPAPEDPLRFLRGGDPVRLAPGQTWVEIVGRDVAFSFGEGAPAGAGTGQGDCGRAARRP